MPRLRGRDGRVSEPATTVYLVRHATHERVDRVLCGRSANVSLSPSGHAQAAALGAWFAGREIAAVLSSPLTRARETAEPIAKASGCSVTLCEDLTEIEFGAWTGRSFAELAEDRDWQTWNAHRAAGCPPGGEPMRSAQERAVRAIDRCRDAYLGARVVAVGHCDVLKAILCVWLGLSLDRYHAFDIAPASVSALALWPGGGKVLFLNDMQAASGPAT